MKKTKKTKPIKTYLLSDRVHNVEIYVPDVIELMKCARRIQARHPHMKLRRVASSVYIIE